MYNTYLLPLTYNLITKDFNANALISLNTQEKHLMIIYYFISAHTDRHIVHLTYINIVGMHNVLVGIGMLYGLRHALKLYG